MKVPNKQEQVSYGVMNGASWWAQQESRTVAGRYRKSEHFFAFKNCAQATKAAKCIVGAKVVRRVVTTTYAVDE